MGISGIWNKLKENVGGVVYVTRWPSTTRSSRFMVTIWATSLAVAVLSIVAHMVIRDYTSPVLFGVLVLTVVDIYMLAAAVKGLLYRRRIDLLVEQMIEGSRHA